MRTINLTLEVSDELAAQLEAMPEGKRNQYATALLQRGYDEEHPDELIDALKEGFAAADRGDGIPLEEYLADWNQRKEEIRAKYAQK